MKNIVLIGISGSGKTGMGKRLAHRLSREFIDLAARGEAGFRLAETEAIKAISGSKDAIIACGGGAVLKEINMELLSQNGIVVFMDRRVKDILRRVNLESRPLLNKAPEKLYKLHRERLPLYERYADFRVRCDGRPGAILHRLTQISRLEQRDMRLAVIGDPIAHSLSPDIHITARSPGMNCLNGLPGLKTGNWKASM